MKRILLFSAVFSAALTAFAALPPRISVSADRSGVSPGGSAMITISLNRGDIKDDFRLPSVRGARWMTNRVSRRNSTSIRNGERSEELSFTLPLIVDASLAPGSEVRIPPMRFTASDGATAVSAPLVLRVAAPGERGAAAPVEAEDPAGEARGEILIPSARSSFRVGEEIPIEFRLSLPFRLRVRSLEYPRLSGLDGAVFADYAKNNPQNPRFAPPEERRSGGRVTILFRTAVRFFAPGKFTPGAELTLTAAVPEPDPGGGRRRRVAFDDDFDSMFSAFFRGETTRPVAVRFTPPARPIEVLALPPAPEGTLPLHLVGDWKISAQLSPRSGRVGEPLELAVSVTGTGDVSALRAPALRLDGFRVYPPETKPFPGGVKLSYVLIPLVAGERSLDPRFALFNTAADRYESAGGPFTVAIAPGEHPAASAFPAAAPAASAPASATPEPPREEAPRTELFYQAATPGDAVRLPLWRNRSVFIAAVLFLGFAAALVIEMRERRREALRSDPSLRRREAHRRAAPDVLRRLERSGNDREFIRQEVVPFLAEGFGLPPGATAGEVAGAIGDPELAAWLRSLESDAFVPEKTESAPAAALSPAALKRLRGVIRRLAAVAVAFLCFGAAGDAPSEHADFDAGRLDAAAERYRRQAGGADSLRPGALYNLGNTLFRQGKFAAARAALETAHRLDPRNAEITGNLNLVNRKLLLPEVDAVGNPGELLRYCRDSFRPDEYLAAAALALAFAAVAAALRRRIPAGLFIGMESALGVLFVLALAAAFSQCSGGPYSRDRAVVVAKEVEIRSRPAAASGRSEVTVPGGGDATILDRRGGWLRISFQGRDGWVRADEVKELFARHE